MLLNGIGPDGTIHWPMAGIVSALHQALRELAVDGWASLDAAARWMSENHPEQTPQKYGCARWRHVIHESGQRSEEHTSELQSLMRISYAVFCLKKYTFSFFFSSFSLFFFFFFFFFFF